MNEFDLHIHSRYSFDSRLDVSKILRVAQRRGLRGLAITDHNTLEGAWQAQALNPDPSQLLVIPGAEVTTDGGDILVYFLSSLPLEKFTSPRPGSGEEEEAVVRAVDLLTYVREQHGVAVLAHPFAQGLTLDREVLSLLHGVEGYNHRYQSTTGRLLKKLGFSIEQFAREYHLFMLGNSDSHRYGSIGRGRTVLPAQTLEEVRDVLLSGMVFPLKARGKLFIP